jgi:protoporphyrinogen/coproporphyrinogen III oxidase
VPDVASHTTTTQRNLGALSVGMQHQGTAIQGQAIFNGQLPEHPHVVVIGGGLSGLVAAYNILKHNVRVTLINAGRTTGGNIASDQIGDFLLEAGPNSFQGYSSPDLMALIQELKLRPLAASSEAKHRYIALGDHLLKAPMNPIAFLQTNLLSIREKWRLLSEPFIPRLKEDVEETVAEFISRRLGEGAHRRLVQPFLTGVYAGDTEALSAEAVFPTLVEMERQHGSIVLGLLKKKLLNKEKRPKSKAAMQGHRKALLNFPEGMAQLPHTLTKHIEHMGGTVIEQQAVDNIYPLNAYHSTDVKLWQIQLQHGITLEADGIILATPAYATANLLHPHDALIAKALNQIDYAPINVTYQAFHNSHIGKKRKGFGTLKCWERPNPVNDAWLGSLWTSSLFPERSPKHHTLISHFFGGVLHPEIRLWDDTRFMREAFAQSQWLLHLQPNTRPALTKSYTYLKGIPQYTLGHVARINFVRDRLGVFGGNIALAGNYLNGINLNNCVRSGQEAADSILNFLLELPTQESKNDIRITSEGSTVS